MPKTNFFQGLETLKIKGTIKLIMTISAEGVWTVTMLIMDPEIKDIAMKQIVPMNFIGTSDKLGEIFFDQLKAPVELLQAGFTNLKELEASIAAAQQVAKDTPIKTTGSSKSTPVLPAKYLEIMKKVDELVAGKKYGQAMAALPTVAKFPQQKALIEAKLKELKRLHGGFQFEEDTEGQGIGGNGAEEDPEEEEVPTGGSGEEDETEE